MSVYPQYMLSLIRVVLAACLIIISVMMILMMMMVVIISTSKNYNEGYNKISSPYTSIQTSQKGIEVSMI
jgi:hypothetical protein